ncbi:hypothetical protein VVMO6_03650 [Vibrio vulnificus MO6-24/O]|nr:hypothetical protein VVMO6_03650 [Vibrio vulnificus MO6-24/O]
MTRSDFLHQYFSFLLSEYGQDDKLRRDSLSFSKEAIG